MFNRTRKWHKTEVSELKAQLKQEKTKFKDEHKAILKVKDKKEQNSAVSSRSTRNGKRTIPKL
jgi:hypothetical protein